MKRDNKITSHRLITHWSQLRLLLGSTRQPVSTIIFFLRTAMAVPLPSKVLTDGRYGNVSFETRTRPAQLFFAVTAQSCYSENELSWSGPFRDNLAVSDLSKVIPSMMILRFEHSIL